MDGGVEEDEYASDPIAQQTRQVSKAVSVDQPSLPSIMLIA